MHEIEHNIFVDSYCLNNEYELQFGEKKDELVNFQYYNFKHNKEGKILQMTYTEAMTIARNKARDRRSKNYQFLIFKI